MNRTRIFIIFLLPCIVAAQDYKPACDFQSLLSLRFYEATGGFHIDGLEMVFPPKDPANIRFAIHTTTGEEVASLPLRIESMHPFPTFGRLMPGGNTGMVDFGKTGNFIASIFVGEEAVTSYPFTMKAETSNDPYNPKTRFIREGPWQSFAYFAALSEKPETHLKFHWWMCLREIPNGAKRPECTVHILRGSQEIGQSNVATICSETDWQHYRMEFITTGAGQKEYLTLASITKKDGEYRVVLKAAGKQFRSHTFRVKGGAIVGLDRSSLDHRPHSEFISPRLIDITSASGSKYEISELYWMMKE